MAALRGFFARPDVLEWGVAPARRTPNADRLKSWVDQGYHGGMEYMARRLAERADPAVLHPWARSAVMFSFPYAAPLGSSRGAYRVAAYAWPGSTGSGIVGSGNDGTAAVGRKSGWDYHDRARGLLRDAEARLRALPGLAEMRFYGFVDTAPVFERDLASEAGLGWRGKNGCTLSRTRGSAFHLAGFLVDLDLPAATPLEEFCGGCTRCLDQCPTGAFQAPGVLDATRCISYWTIESRAPAPPSLAGSFGGWIFGCDVCQEVCPWNRKHLAPESRPEAGGRMTARDSGAEPAATEPSTASSAFPGDAGGWLDLLRQGGGFRSRFKDSPLARAGRRGLLRNLATAMGNLGDTSARDKLREVLEAEQDPALREVLARALSTLEAPEAASPGPGTAP